MRNSNRFFRLSENLQMQMESEEKLRTEHLQQTSIDRENEIEFELRKSQDEKTALIDKEKK